MSEEKLNETQPKTFQYCFQKMEEYDYQNSETNQSFGEFFENEILGDILPHL